MPNRSTAKGALSASSAGVLICSLWIYGCAGGNPEPEAAQEQPATAHTVETSRPVTNVPTTLTLELDGEKLSLPASARLELGIDDRIELSAATPGTDNAFSMHLTVSSDTTKLAGTSFKLEQGLKPANELGIARSQLPNVTVLRSVSGSARVLAFEEEKIELTFDAVLSKDPRGGGDEVHATGTLTGVASLVCLEKGSPSNGAHLESTDGQSQTIRAIDLEQARCQPLVRLRDKS